MSWLKNAKCLLIESDICYIVVAADMEVIMGEKFGDGTSRREKFIEIEESDLKLINLLCPILLPVLPGLSPVLSSGKENRNIELNAK